MKMFKAAYKFMISMKAAKHSKSQDIMKSEMMKERYQDDKRFQLRTRMNPVKSNFSSILKDDVSCRLCKDTVKIEAKLI